MKNFHGMFRIRGWGLRSILFQAKPTAIAVNLKRIAAVTGEKNSPVTAFLQNFWEYVSKPTSKDDLTTILNY